MINQGIRQFDPAVTDFEVDWLNEGLSHFAEEAVGRAARGFGDFQSLTAADVKSNADDYNAYFQQNLARFSTWLARPDTSSPISSRADRDLAPRGAAWALLRYTADQFAPGNARAFFRGLVAGPKTGVTNFVQHAGVSFDQIIGGWLIANYADNLAIPNLDARYSYVSWNMRDAVAGARQSQTYPLPTPAPGAALSRRRRSRARVSTSWRRARPAPRSRRSACSIQAVEMSGSTERACTWFGCNEHHCWTSAPPRVNERVVLTTEVTEVTGNCQCVRQFP